VEVGPPLHAAFVLQADELAAQRGADIYAVAENLDDADAGIGVGPLLNINAFASNSALQLGNAPPLLPERGCGWLGEDLNVQKNFTIKESTRLEFRSEFYNLFNRTKWADPSVNINSPSTFGRILGVDGRYQARTIQLGLKLLF